MQEEMVFRQRKSRGGKADQIRIYSGAKFEMLKEAEAGTVCAVTGLTETYPGEELGIGRILPCRCWNRY